MRKTNSSKLLLSFNAESRCLLAVYIFILYSFFLSVIAQGINSKICYGMIPFSMILALSSLYDGKRFFIYNDIIKKMSGWIICLSFFVLFIGVIIKKETSLGTILFLWSMEIAVILAHYPNIYKKLIKFIILCALINAAATFLFLIKPSLYEHMYNFYGYWPTGTLNGEDGYKAGITNHYTSNGFIMAMGLLASTVDLIAEKKYIIRGHRYTLKMINILIFFMALILTSKRAHFIFALAALLVVYFIVNKQQKKIISFRHIIIIFFVFIIIFVLNQIQDFNILFERLLNIGKDESSYARIDLWTYALKIFKEHPILGIGWGKFKYAYFNAFKNMLIRSKYQLLNVHNVYIQLLAETGIIGFIFFIYNMLHTLYNGVHLVINKCKSEKKLSQQDSPLVYAVLVQIFFILYGFTGNCFYDITICQCGIVIGITMGYYHIYYRERTRSKK